MKFTLDENYKSPLMFAVGLHVILIILLVVHFKFSSEQPVTESSTHVIQAVAVSANQLSNSKPVQQNIPKPVVQNSVPVAKPVPPPQQVIKQPSPVVVKQPPTPPQPTQQQLAVEQQAAAELALQKAQALAQKKAAQQAALKLVQQQAATALNEQLQAQVQQQKQAQQKQQLQNAQQATQQLLQQELTTTTPTTDNTATTTTAASAADQGQIDKYKALIIAAISQQWIVPDIKNKNESCKILVHLAPGGVVLDVTITQSSGDDVLDRSAVTAINKASPLPVPKDSALFDSFRDINLTVQPQGILADNSN